MSGAVCASVQAITAQANRMTGDMRGQSTWIFQGTSLACSPYLITGLSLALFAVGCIMTISTYHNHQGQDSNRSLVVLGPLCLVAGILATARLILRRFKKSRSERQAVRTASQSSGRFPQPSPLHSSGTVERHAPYSPQCSHRLYVATPSPQRQPGEDEQAIYLEPTSPDSMCPYSDEPPTYSQATQYQAAAGAQSQSCFGAIVNPALEAEETPPGNSAAIWRQATPPPPPYEQCKHITQTSL